LDRIVLQVALGQRKQVSIFGSDYPTRDGTCVRDYVHVSDLATAHIACLKHLDDPTAPAFDTFNLGSGEGFSVREIVAASSQVTKLDIPAQHAARRAGDPATLIAASAKAERELGWQRRYTSVESVIESAWRFHSSHPNGFAE
jgi:UDP-glucose 4-epimerase